MTADSASELIAQVLPHAVALHQAGRLNEAAELYRTILSVQPQHPEAQRGLAAITQQAVPEIKAGQKAPTQAQLDEVVTLFNQGRLADAAARAEWLTEQFPKHGFAWKVLGLALKQMGRNEEAIPAMQQAAALSPKEADAHSNLGVALHDAGRLQEAEASYRRALKLKPDYADAHCNLGTLLQDMGRLADAEASHRRAIKLAPGLADAHFNLGNTLRAQGRLEMAAGSYQSALQCRPGYAAASCNLGIVLHDRGFLDQAEAQLRKTLEMDPRHVAALTNLGNTLKEKGEQDEAEACYRRAITIDPSQAEAHNNLGILLQGQGELTSAQACYQRAVELDPGYAEVYNNLGGLLQDIGDLAAAEDSYRQALQLRPGYAMAHSNLLFMFNYSPAVSQQAAFEEAQRFGAAVTAQAIRRYGKWNCAQQPERLRIGFVSGDFRNHPVGYFLENLLQYLDRDAFELYAYPTDAWTDETTLRLKSHFVAWKPLVGLDDEAAAKLIHGDGVHILFDLSGHSRYNRLPMFAYKPAPVQVAWLGYFATTGVAEMDYLIADPITLPESQERYFTEKIVRMPDTRLCFTRPEVTVDTSELPALTNGYVTFGCFNNLAKMNDDVVALWSRVLLSVAGSKLFLKSKQLGDDAVRQQTQARFAAHGIPEQRLILEGAESREKYFSAYHRVDIALDPFPFPGGTTTVESLWMGVPVLNLGGDSFLRRQGAGFMCNVGLAEWVADSAEDYVACATSCARNLDALASLRAGLRSRVEASPIMDGRHFAEHFGVLLQAMRK